MGAAIVNGLYTVQTQSFKNTYFNKSNIYGDGYASGKIIKKIKEVDASKLLMKKSVFS